MHVMPAPPDAPPRRDVLVQIRLTPGERSRWRAAARYEDLRLAEFIRVGVRARMEHSVPAPLERLFRGAV
jgi:hypothetical protein